MGQIFSDGVEEAIRLVWMQFDRDRIRQGKDLLERAAGEGGADAACFLAMTYMDSGFLWKYAGLETDGREAARLLKESILRGSACGVLAALICGELTPSVRRDMPFSSLRAAWDDTAAKAAQGHPFCQYLIGNTYAAKGWLEVSGEEPRSGCASEAEYLQAVTRETECLRMMAREAVPWLEKAVSGGLSLAGYPLAALYRQEDCADPGAERRTAEACARLGAPDWEEELGRFLYEEGRLEESFRLCQKAAQAGQISAWNFVGCGCLYGEGTPPDPSLAFECFQKGAQGGDPAAQVSLAWMYFEGTHVPGDAARAAYWARMAAQAKAGEREYAYPLLAHLLLHGLGVARDVDKAVSLLRKASEFNLTAEEDFSLDDRDCRLLYRDMGEICEKGLEDGDILLDRAACAYRVAAEAFGDRESANRLNYFKKGMFGKWRRK